MSKRIKVVVDDDIPFIKGTLEPYASVLYYKGDKIDSQEVLDADALIIRTRTKCNARLLNGSKVKFIASATIGTDHIDMDYCRKNGIVFTNAAGCNAWGVVQYVLTAIFSIAKKKDIDLTNKIIGIIGAGNVGERLAVTCESLGFRVLRCDPPVKEILTKNLGFNDAGRFSVDRSTLKPEQFFDLWQVTQKADIVTLHVPLDSSTRALFGKDFFSSLKPGAIFINSSRGEVIDEVALMEARQKLAGIALDVWKNEPEINQSLMKMVDIATPHIAGYSLEGKMNATMIVVREFSKYFSIKELSDFGIDYPEPYTVKTDNLCSFLTESFPIYDEDKKLRENPCSFEKIRSSYTYRREISGEMYRAIGKINQNHDKIC
ncbi:MAG: 4-phosphoerythronate dehydrogenase [Bacteroidales bacterium]